MDQLDQYLKEKYSESYISGDEHCSLLLWGYPDSDGNVTPRMITVTVGVSYPASTKDKAVIRRAWEKLWNDERSAFRRLYQCGKYLSETTGFRLAIICFPKEASVDTTYDNVSFLGIFSSDTRALKESVLLNGAELKKRLYSEIGIDDREIGTTKEVNRSIADFFHAWSRDYLSPKLIKLDIDGMFLFPSDKKNAGKLLLEIKRSNIPPIPKWRPYSNDLPDYQLLLAFASKIGAELWILHHDGMADCNENTIISLFIVDKVHGGNMTYRKEILSLRLGGKESFDTILREAVGWNTIL